MRSRSAPPARESTGGARRSPPEDFGLRALDVLGYDVCVHVSALLRVGLVFGGLTFGAACASPRPAAEPSPPPTIPSPPAPVKIATAPPPPFDPYVPADAALTASVDLGRLGVPAIDMADPYAWLGNGFLLALEQRLAPNGRGPVSPETLAEAGLDLSRPLRWATAGISKEGRSMLAALRPLVPTSLPEEAGGVSRVAAIRAAMARGAVSSAYRLLLPARDVAKVERILDTVLGLSGWLSSGTGIYWQDKALARVTGEGDTVALDIAVGDHPQSALDALRASVHERHDEAPSLDGDAIRIHLAPPSLAEMGFLSGTRTLLPLLEDDSDEPATRERTAARGLWEASQAVAVVETEKGPRFQSIDLRIPADAQHGVTRMRIEQGPGAEPIAEDLWADSFTPVAGAQVDVSRPFLSAWKLPGERSASALDKWALLDRIDAGGVPALLTDLPDIMLARAVLSASRPPAPGRPVLERIARFGRTRVTPVHAPRHGEKLEPQGPMDVFFGVLADKAPPATAECILAGPAPCGTRRLPLGAVTKDGAAYVLLTQIAGRFVLLRAASADALSTCLRALRASSSPPIRFSLEAEAVPSFFAPKMLGPGTVTLTHDPTGMTFELKH